MKITTKFKAALFICTALILNTSVSPSFADTSKPFSTPPTELQYLKANDGITLAYRHYPASSTTQAVLIFLHSSGTHSALAYPEFAHNMSQSYDISVITPDLRGHGFSGGERGDTQSIESMYDDINAFIELANRLHPNAKVILGGHSTGAGLAINHSAYAKALPVHGYAFVAPYLGFLAQTEREGKRKDWVTIDFDKFSEYARSRTGGHQKAVFYHFPPALLQQNPEMVTSISVLMSHALTPRWPHHQIKDIQVPIGVWIGKEDDGMDPTKVEFFIQNANDDAHTEILPELNHLSVLSYAHKKIGPWVKSQP